MTMRMPERVALVAHVADALDLLGAHQFGDALQQGLLVHLIGDLGDDDRLRSLRISSISVRARMVIESAPGLERRADAGAADDDAAGRKIRAGHDRISASSVMSGIGDQRQRGVDDLARIVRRDVGRHADGDAVAAVDQQVGERAGRTFGSFSVSS
jgi:hypothetical protein